MGSAAGGAFRLGGRGIAVDRGFTGEEVQKGSRWLVSRVVVTAPAKAAGGTRALLAVDRVNKRLFLQAPLAHLLRLSCDDKKRQPLACPDDARTLGAPPAAARCRVPHAVTLPLPALEGVGSSFLDWFGVGLQGCILCHTGQVVGGGREEATPAGLGRCLGPSTPSSTC